jgi:hypothetical protein
MPGTDMVLRNQEYARQLAATPASAKEDSDSGAGFSFGDFLDIINPLQHIPVVSTLYRHWTGDTIGTPEKIAGDTLYGGLTGLACSVGDALFTELTGKDVGDTVYAALIGDDKTTPATAVAANTTDADNTPDDLSTTPQATPYQAAAAYRTSGRLLAAY